MAATWAGGTILQRGANPIAVITSLTGPTHSAATKDVTPLSSTGFSEFMVTTRDAGEISMEGHFDAANVEMVAMHGDLGTGMLRAYTLVFPPAMGATMTFDAYVTAFSTGASRENEVPFSATLKLTGPPSLNVTASNNITALTGIEENLTAALDFVPNFLAGTYTYAVDVINTASTWVKFTATFAAGTATVWVGGVLIETLVSTVQSGAIAIGAANSITDITLQVKETNKVATTYVIRVPRP